MMITAMIKISKTMTNIGDNNYRISIKVTKNTNKNERVITENIKDNEDNDNGKIMKIMIMIR